MKGLHFHVNLMSVHSTSPIMSQSNVQVIPMEEQRRRESWTQQGPRGGKIEGPYRSGYHIGEDEGNYVLFSKADSSDF